MLPLPSHEIHCLPFRGCNHPWLKEFISIPECLLQGLVSWGPWMRIRQRWTGCLCSILLFKRTGRFHMKVICLWPATVCEFLCFGRLIDSACWGKCIVPIYSTVGHCMGQSNPTCLGHWLHIEEGFSSPFYHKISCTEYANENANQFNYIAYY